MDERPPPSGINIGLDKMHFPLEEDETVVTVMVDHLVIGAGPAGASMGCFLGQHGMTHSDKAE
jgi:hypothetical protein